MFNPSTFAAQWIADWNSHDVDAILAHYAPDVVFHSPKVALFTKGAQTQFTSREELRPYFKRAFQWRPTLYFDLISACQDTRGMALVYKDDTGATAVEIMDLNAQGQIVFARVMYDR